MDIVITLWAFNAYLELKHRQAFSSEEYWQQLRPDVLLLKHYPEPPKFKNGKFWSVYHDGFKMKWHQVGAGCVQLRLPIAILDKEAILCQAYIKSDEKKERRSLAQFKTHLKLIQENRYISCGALE